MRLLHLLPLVLAALACAAQPMAEPQRLGRLAILGKVWGQVKAIHPALLTREIDWDQALLKAIPRAEAARDPAELADAVDGMLADLGDPATHVLRPPSLEGVDWTREQGMSAWLAPGTLLLRLHSLSTSFTESNKINGQIEELCALAGRADRVILDLRPPAWLLPISQDHREGESVYQADLLGDLVKVLAGKPLTLPTQRFRTDLGFRGHPSDDHYFSGLTLKAGSLIQPGSPGRTIPTAILVNDQSLLAEPLLALCKARMAVLITEGDPGRDWSADSRTLPFGDGLAVAIRSVDRVFPDASTACVADAKVTCSRETGAGAPAIQAGLSALGRPFPARPAAGADLASLLPVFRPERSYPERPYPDRALRILAAIRFWTVVDQYFPYKDLLDQPWSTALEEFLQRFESARDAKEYQLAVLAMVARLQDSHGSLVLDQGSFYQRAEPEAIREFFGTGTLPLSLAMVDGQPTLTGLWDKAMAKAGFRPGDAVLAVDGEPVQARLARFRPFVAASTPQRLEFNLVNRLLGGPLGQPARVEVRGADGRVRELQAVWGRQGGKRSNGVRPGEAVRILAGGIGYVDLDKVAAGQVEPMLPALKKTRGLIFDMRGYPSSGTLDAVSAFIRDLTAAPYQAGVPLVLGLPWADPDRNEMTVVKTGRFTQTRHSEYPGPIVVLIDERAQSWAESTCMDLEAGCKATFIGSATSGADGMVTTLPLPGGLRAKFTGEGYRHGDGRRLQRVGIIADIPVRATAKGLAEGRDDVLERALAFMADGR